MDEIGEREKHAEVLKAENEEKAEELSLEEKKAAIRHAKEMYGKDWKKMVGVAVKGFGKLRVKGEALQNLHSLGMGGQEMRDMSNPAYLNRKR